MGSYLHGEKPTRFFFFFYSFYEASQQTRHKSNPISNKMASCECKTCCGGNGCNGSVDALPAVASEQRQPNLRLSLAPKSRGGRSLQRKCASAAIQGSSSRLWIPVLVSYSVTVQ